MSSPIIRCASCGAPMIWLTTAAGKAMPVDASSVSEGDELYDSKRHVSHFATCPQAADHRRRGKKP